MWFNDIDIKLRRPSTHLRSMSVAPLRDEVALARYLERNASRKAEVQAHRTGGGFTMMESWIELLMPRFRRPSAGRKPPRWRDALLKFPYR